ncbi:MAG: hydrogenase maturation protease [Promethearchaeota archaeon]
MKDIQKQLQQICAMKENVIIFGVGNPLQGDDGVGAFIAENLVSKLHTFKAMSAEGSPENFVGKIDRLKPEILILIDAAIFEGQEGEIKLIPPEEIMGLTISTHQLPLSMLGKFLQHSNPDLRILFIGIQIVNMEFLSSSLTKPVEAAAQKIISMFIELDQIRLRNQK